MNSQILGKISKKFACFCAKHQELKIDYFFLLHIANDQNEHTLRGRSIQKKSCLFWAPQPVLFVQINNICRLTPLYLLKYRYFFFQSSFSLSIYLCMLSFPLFEIKTRLWSAFVCSFLSMTTIGINGTVTKQTHM